MWKSGWINFLDIWRNECLLYVSTSNNDRIKNVKIWITFSYDHFLIQNWKIFIFFWNYKLFQFGHTWTPTTLKLFQIWGNIKWFNRSVKKCCRFNFSDFWIFLKFKNSKFLTTCKRLSSNLTDMWWNCYFLNRYK